MIESRRIESRRMESRRLIESRKRAVESCGRVALMDDESRGGKAKIALSRKRREVSRGGGPAGRIVPAVPGTVTCVRDESTMICPPDDDVTPPGGYVPGG